MMGWFSKKISSPDEAYERLIQKDKKVSERAKSDFVDNMSYDFVEFLVEKFEEEDSYEVRLRILEIFAEANSKLCESSLQLILTLIRYPDTLFRETFKEILSKITEDNIKAVTEVISKTVDKDIHLTVQYAIEKSGLLDVFLRKWHTYGTKDKVLYLEEIVKLQNPKVYPIFIDILKEEVIESKKDEKRIIQVEFSKHIDKIRNPEFLELCIKELPAIAPIMCYPVLKSLQIHGNIFFTKVFEKLESKNETFRWRILKIIKQLSDPVSYPYLFPFLKDPYKPVLVTVGDTIGEIVRHHCDELEKAPPEIKESPETQERIRYFTVPLETSFGDRFLHSVALTTECLLRLGHYDKDIILRNFSKIYKYSENYFKSFLRGLDTKFRKELLISACCYNDITTGQTALKFLSDPTENYIIETLNTLLLEHFMEVSTEIQSEIINLMMDPRLKRFATEALYHQNPELRAQILWILGKSGSPNALQIIETRLGDPDYVVRENILKILELEHFRNPTGTEILLKLLKDSDSSIVLKTVEILQKRDHHKIIGSMTKLLTSNILEIKQTAHEAIAFITRRKYIAGFDKMNDETKLAIGSSLIKMDSSFMETMTKNLSASDQKARVLSAKVLEVLCNFITPELKTDLIVAINDPDPQVRAVVIMCLGKIGGPGISGLLIGFLKDQDDRVRASAVESLAIVGDLSLVEYIHPCLHDENNRVRANAIITLWKLGYYSIYDSIIETLRHTDKWMRASAAFALGELHDTRFLPILIQFTQDPDPDVRRNVVKALGKIAAPVVIAPYIRPLRFDSDETVRKEVMAILTAKPVTK